MNIKTIASDYYLIGETNTIANAYLKNGLQKLGGYEGRNQYCWEAVAKLNFSSIPVAATILSVTVDVNIVNFHSSGTHDLQVREQDRGVWYEDSGTEPSRLNPAYFDQVNVVFANILSGEEVPNSPNTPLIITIPSSTTLVQLVQDQLDGVKDVDNGLMITYYSGYHDYYIEIDAIQFTIEYESAAPPSRRKVMVIS